MEARNLRKERTGVVLSDKMDKTITVAAKFKENTPYGKFVSKTKSTMLMMKRMVQYQRYCTHHGNSSFEQD